MNELDSPRIYKQLDPSGMLQHLHAFPEQCQRAWYNSLKLELPRDYNKVDRVIISGMGGSAIGGELIRRLAILENHLPVWVHRDYGLPPFVNRNTLLIFSSYSGNTEETLSSFSESLQTPSKKVVITTGGKLEALAERNGIPTLLIDYKAPPRAAFPHSFVSLLGIFHTLGLIKDKSNDLEEALQVLKELSIRITEKVPSASNEAKQLAQELYGRLVVIYGAGLLAEVAQRWKSQLNENSKTWAFHEVFPELNHNAVVGYQLPPELRDRILVVLLHSSLLHQRVSIRYQLTTEILNKASVRYKVLEATGKSHLAQMMNLVLYGDYVSFYLAILNGVDPTQVVPIDYLKSRLAEY